LGYSYDEALHNSAPNISLLFFKCEPGAFVKRSIDIVLDRKA